MSKQEALDRREASWIAFRALLANDSRSVMRSRGAGALRARVPIGDLVEFIEARLDNAVATVEAQTGTFGVGGLPPAGHTRMFWVQDQEDVESEARLPGKAFQAGYFSRNLLTLLTTADRSLQELPDLWVQALDVPNDEHVKRLGFSIGRIEGRAFDLDAYSQDDMNSVVGSIEWLPHEGATGEPGDLVAGIRARELHLRQGGTVRVFGIYRRLIGSDEASRPPMFLANGYGEELPLGVTWEAFVFGPSGRGPDLGPLVVEAQDAFVHLKDPNARQLDPPDPATYRARRLEVLELARNPATATSDLQALELAESPSSTEAPSATDVPLSTEERLQEPTTALPKHELVPSPEAVPILMNWLGKPDLILGVDPMRAWPTSVTYAAFQFYGIDAVADGWLTSRYQGSGRERGLRRVCFRESQRDVVAFALEGVMELKPGTRNWPVSMPSDGVVELALIPDEQFEARKISSKWGSTLDPRGVSIQYFGAQAERRVEASGALNDQRLHIVAGRIWAHRAPLLLSSAGMRRGKFVMEFCIQNPRTEGDRQRTKTAIDELSGSPQEIPKVGAPDPVVQAANPYRADTTLIFRFNADLSVEPRSKPLSAWQPGTITAAPVGPRAPEGLR